MAVTTATGVPSLDALCDRRQILQLWVAEVRLPVPRLEDQGSDQLLKRQFKHCSQGEIGWIASKYIISALPEQDERPIKSNRKITVDGWEKEEEEETRKLPTTRRQLEHMHLIFRTNLLMAKLSFPSMPRLNVTHADLEDWYRWFWGKDIADRRPTLGRAQRLARDPQPRVRRHGTQGSHGPNPQRHPLLDEGGLRVSASAERHQGQHLSKLPFKTSQIQRAYAQLVTVPAPVEQSQELTQGQDQRGHGSR